MAMLNKAVTAVIAGCLSTASIWQPDLEEEGGGTLVCKLLLCGVNLEHINIDRIILNSSLVNHPHQRKMEFFYALALIAGIIVAFILLVLIATSYDSLKAKIPPEVDQPSKLSLYHYFYTLVEILVSLSCSVIL